MDTLAVFNFIDKIYLYFCDYKLRSVLKTCLSLLIILIHSQSVFSQNFLIEEDLKLDWVFYNNEEKVMLPFLENGHENPEAIHLSLDLINFGKESKLLIEIPGNTSLFLDNKFVKSYEDSTCLLLLVDSLYSIFQKESLQLTLFNTGGFKNPSNAKVGFIHRTFDDAIYHNPVEKRNIDNRREYYKIIILILFTFFVLLQTLFPAELNDFLSLHIFVTFRITNTLLLKYRSISKIQLLIIVYQAALLSGVLIIFLNYYDNPLSQVYFLIINPIFGWLITLGIILILLLAKYILISIFSLLFGIGERIIFYFMEFLKMAMIFYSFIFAVLSYTVINHFNVIPDLLKSLVLIIVLFYLFRFVILFVKFRRTISMKSLYLFSYLCTTEVIPIIVGLIFFIK